MKRLYTLVVAAALCFPSIGAWAWWQSIQQVSIGGAAAYVGPGDINGAAAVWYGIRAFSAAKRGTKVANVCNSTGGVDVGCADMFSDAVTGLIVPATISTITCPGANCTVKTLYDQSGSTLCTGPVACDVTQATVASRPTLVASGLGSLPVMAFSGVQKLVSATGLISSQAQPYTFSGVVIRSGAFTTKGFYFSIGGIAAAGFAASTNTFDFFSSADATQAGVADSAWHSIQVTANGASSNYYIDGSSTTHSPGTASYANLIFVGDDSFTERLTGSMTEAGAWASDKSANNATMCNNQFVFWGTSTSC